jgi:hypothetical protein
MAAQYVTLAEVHCLAGVFRSPLSHPIREQLHVTDSPVRNHSILVRGEAVTQITVGMVAYRNPLDWQAVAG